MSVKFLETEGTSEKLLIGLCQGFHARCMSLRHHSRDLHASRNPEQIALAAGDPVVEVPGGCSVGNHAHLTRHWGHA